jgi:hypothetical protein
MTAAAPVLLDQTPLPAKRPSAAAVSSWLVSPKFDLLFVSNLYWPLLILFAAVAYPLQQKVDFWLIYLLIMPHRWITLVLVFGDHDRYAERSRAFLGLAVAMTLVVIVNAVAIPTLTLLLIIDFFWNAWHFAAQHAGIARIYSRISAKPSNLAVNVEKYAIRAFAFYVFLRMGVPLMAAERTQWLNWLDIATPYFTYLDWPMMACPIVVLAMAIAQWTELSIGRIMYLSSVLSLYSIALIALHFQDSILAENPFLIGSLMGITAFHSLEYLAIVTWSVDKRYAKPGVGSGPMTYFAKRWVWFLVVFLGSVGIGAWLLDQNYKREWYLVNVLVSYLHYAYDGLIWKARPGTPKS